MPTAGSVAPILGRAMFTIVPSRKTTAEPMIAALSAPRWVDVTGRVYRRLGANPDRR
jgi:hypothetical protein